MVDGQTRGVCELDADSGLPRCAQASIRISNDDPLVFSHSTVGFSEVRTVWNRRRSAPEPRPGTHPADVSTVKQQSMLFLANLLSSIAEDAVWVNSLESQRIADQKLVSLSLAKECGFSIPDTLASNDPVRVRAFAERHGWDVIAKNFVQGGWRTADGNLVMMRTSRLDRNSLQGDGAILKCPMIFQPYIRKERELRVTVIGNQVFPFSVVCNDTETVDWRIDEAAGAVRFEPVSIPSALEQACLRLCRRVGLRFAAIDILVLADGTSLFLEVNEGASFSGWRRRVLRCRFSTPSAICLQLPSQVFALWNRYTCVSSGQVRNGKKDSGS